MSTEPPTLRTASRISEATTGRISQPRSTLLIAVVLTLTLSGCTGATLPGSAATACAPVEEHPTTPGGHLLGDTAPPEEYSTVPPTSGWHTSGPPRFGVAQPPLSEPEQVSVLEQGGVVISYRDLPMDSLRRLREIAEAHPDRVALTAYRRLEEGTLALTAWGALQRCEEVETETIEDFLADHRGTTPENQHS